MDNLSDLFGKMTMNAVVCKNKMIDSVNITENVEIIVVYYGNKTDNAVSPEPVRAAPCLE